MRHSTKNLHKLGALAGDRHDGLYRAVFGWLNENLEFRVGVQVCVGFLRPNNKFAFACTAGILQASNFVVELKFVFCPFTLETLN